MRRPDHPILLPGEPEDDGVDVPPMLGALDRIRHEAPSDPGDAVRVLLHGDARDPSASIHAIFEHTACEVEMTWVAHGRCWICEECGFELSPAEARFVVDREQSLQLRLVRALEELGTDVWQKAGGRRWGLLPWLKAMWARLRSSSTSRTISARSESMHR